MITCGTQEPYRMFTSRAEYRLLLREDNADLRLTEQGRQLGLIDDSRWFAFKKKRDEITRLQGELVKKWVRKDTDEAERVANFWGKPLLRETNLIDLLRRPEVDIKQLMSLVGNEQISEQVAEQVEIQAKYAGYIERQQTEIDRAKRYDHLRLPQSLDYAKVPGLSNEVSEKLTLQRPETLGQAARIPGVTPAAVSLLLVHMKKKSA